MRPAASKQTLSCPPAQATACTHLCLVPRHFLLGVCPVSLPRGRSLGSPRNGLASYAAIPTALLPIRLPAALPGPQGGVPGTCPAPIWAWVGALSVTFQISKSFLKGRALTLAGRSQTQPQGEDKKRAEMCHAQRDTCGSGCHAQQDTRGSGCHAQRDILGSGCHAQWDTRGSGCHAQQDTHGSGYHAQRDTRGPNWLQTCRCS